MPGTVYVLNADEVVRSLEVLPARLRAKILRPALEAGADVIAAAIQAEAPRHLGKLAATITSRKRKKRRVGSVGWVVWIGGTRDQLGVPATTKQGTPRGYYPAAINYGWKPRRRGRRRISKAAMSLTAKGRARLALEAEFGTRRVPANPYVTRGFQMAKAQALAVIEAKVKEGLVKMLSKVNPSLGLAGGGGEQSPLDRFRGYRNASDEEGLDWGDA